MTKRHRKPDIAAATNALDMAMTALGYDTTEPAIRDTPDRIARAWADLTEGYDKDPEAALGRVFEDEEYDQMVALAGISFVSMCEHHLLPFRGKAHVAYVPRLIHRPDPDSDQMVKVARVVGLSKLARLVDMYAMRLQLQERMTKQIADTLIGVLACRGAMVVVEAEHQCMACRGVRKPGARMITSAVRGVFTKPDVKKEALGLFGLR
jgi:GTP cyclohydrolase I